MLTLRKSEERGHFDHGWLNTYHTFSFADYYDPRFEHYGHLRVINEDFVQPGMGFGTHSHRNMEIVTFILQGALEHKDSMGNTSVIRKGDVQRMSAGLGVKHSEFNPSDKEPVHLLQIWILPDAHNIAPEYEQKAFDDEGKRNGLRLIVSPDGRSGSVTMHQDALLFDCLLTKDRKIGIDLHSGRMGWLQIMGGSVKAEGVRLEAGDGGAVNSPGIQIEAEKDASFLFFDLKQV